MRPRLNLLTPSLRDRITSEARELLRNLGVIIHNEDVLVMLADHGAQIDTARSHVLLNDEIIDRALATTPRSFALYDVLGRQTHEFADDNIYFTPGSAAINILDSQTNSIRRPTTADYVRYTKVVSRLDHLASQSTAMIPADVNEQLSDSYRLYLSLMHGEKPVVTGAFTTESFKIMHAFQLAVRGSDEALRARPLTIFSCCPTAPLKWSDVTSQNVVDCARSGIPVEFISMPLSGFVAPVTLVGSLVQHTAETLSGLVISQSVAPGAPILYGGSPAIFDVRYETTPMGAVETMMMDCAYSEIGKHLGLPTQAYIGLSDAKHLDAQAGLESSMGATLAALAGINNIAGPGMLDFESCFSLEKLVVDHEICGMVLRLAKGIEARDDFPAVPLFEELLRDKHLLISKHTRKHLSEEHYVPGPVLDRANRSRWQEEGALTLRERARNEVDRLLLEYTPSRLPEPVKEELTHLMVREAQRFGVDRLPDHDP